MLTTLANPSIIFLYSINNPGNFNIFQINKEITIKDKKTGKEYRINNNNMIFIQSVLTSSTIKAI